MIKSVVASICVGALMSVTATAEEPMQRGLGSGAASTNAGLTPPASERIDIMLDRNKGALYALYGRALRDNPELHGKFRYRLVISTAGLVTQCTVLSSELNDPALEARLCARLSLVRFTPLPESMTIERSIDFFPAA